MISRTTTSKAEREAVRHSKRGCCPYHVKAASEQTLAHCPECRRGAAWYTYAGSKCLACSPAPRVVADGPCLLFAGSKTTGGYGQRRFNGRLWLAHRVVWYIAHGPIPRGAVVRHLCHAPACVRLSHLAVGTQIENAADDVARGVRPQPSSDRHRRYHVSEKGREAARRQKRTPSALAKQRERDKKRRALGHDVRPVKVGS